MADNFTIHEFDVSTSDENLWEQFIDLQIDINRLENPRDPDPPREHLRKSLEQLPQNPMFKLNVLYALQSESGRMVGLSILGLPKEGSPNYESGKHMAITKVFMAPEARRQGLGYALLREVVYRIQAFGGITLLQGDSNTPEGNAFADALGADAALLTRENRLYAEDINWELVNEWEQEGPLRAQGVTIETIHGLPADDIIDEFSQLYSEVYNQQPFGEIEGLDGEFTAEKLRENHALGVERGTERVFMITREPDGVISGVTEIVRNPKTAHRVSQGMTGVSEQFRGRGLGKWLKAEMLLFIREHYPEFEFVTTTNANENAPMMSINDRLGFKLYKQVTLYKIPVEKLKQQLMS